MSEQRRGRAEQGRGSLAGRSGACSGDDRRLKAPTALEIEDASLYYTSGQLAGAELGRGGHCNEVSHA
jgi:hypothetical protein